VQASDGGTSLLSAGVLAYASTRLFSQLKRALDQMWDIETRSGEGLRGKAWKQLRKRALAFVMVLFVGVMIVLLVALKAVLAAATTAIGGPLAGAAWQMGEIVLSLATTTLLFAMVFKVMPDAHLAWRDAWAGAFVTAVLFSIGAVLIGLYVGHKGLASTYGAAASIVMLLLWVHYSAQVFFVGAAFTAVLAEKRGRPISPTENAIRAGTGT
jgi:membrane protein